jgi:hypothetical protein
MNNLDQHPKAADLRFDLPPDWYLQTKEEYGDEVWYCQHPEAMVSTQTHDSPETAAQYAHQKHRANVDPDHILPWEQDANDELENEKIENDEMSGALTPTSDSAPEHSSTTLPTETVEVFDAEAGEMVTRSPQDQRMAVQLMRAIQMSTMVQAVALARLEEGRHYLDMGHSTFKAFAQAELPIGYRTAKMYLKIGRRFSGMLPEVDASEEATREALEEQIKESGQVRPFAAMGVSKLREISKLEEEDMEALAEGKVLEDPETGETYSLDDLKEMASREAKEVIEEIEREKEAYQAQAQRKEETIKRLKSEKESMEAEVEDAREAKREALELEAQYGPTAQTYEENKEALQDTRDLLFDVRESLFRADLDTESADGLKNQLLELVRELNAIHADARRRFAEALRTAEDTIAMEDDFEIPDHLEERIAESNAPQNGSS